MKSLVIVVEEVKTITQHVISLHFQTEEVKKPFGKAYLSPDALREQVLGCGMAFLSSFESRL